MNRGIDIAREQAEQDGTEYKVGAMTPVCLAAIPVLDRMKYLPDGELQYGVEDFMDCATRAPINILAAKFTYHYQNGMLPENKRWLEDHGYVQNGRVDFSDRFIAILSNTTRDGNSFKAPLQAIHEKGLIPKPMLPRTSDMTFVEYHDRTRITQHMLSLGEEFAARFKINYYQIPRSTIRIQLNIDQIEVGGHAWPVPQKNVFGPTDEPINHAFDLIQPEYFAFDNYLDGDNDFVKRLTPDYRFYDYGYQIILTSETDNPEIASKQTFLAFLLSIFGLQRLLRTYTAPAATSTAPVIPAQNAPETTPEPKPIQTPSSRLYDLAFASQGQDLSRSAPNERGCAESLSRLINQIDPGFPVLISTAAMMPYLRKRYREVTMPEPGDIAIFPTNGGVTGHCGVWGKNHVMSNNSSTGKFEANYTHPAWLAAAKQRGLKNYFFRMVEH